MGLCSSRKGEPKKGAGGPGSQGQHLDSELLGETYQKLFGRDQRPRGRKAVQRVIQALKHPEAGRGLDLPFPPGHLHGDHQLRPRRRHLQVPASQPVGLRRPGGLPGPAVFLLGPLPRGAHDGLRRSRQIHLAAGSRLRDPRAEGDAPGGRAERILHPANRPGQAGRGDLHPGGRQHHLPGQSGPLRSHGHDPGHPAGPRDGSSRRDQGELGPQVRDVGGRGSRGGGLLLRGPRGGGAVLRGGDRDPLRAAGLLARLLLGHLRRPHLPPAAAAARGERDGGRSLQHQLARRVPLRPARAALVRPAGSAVWGSLLRLPLLPPQPPAAAAEPAPAPAPAGQQQNPPRGAGLPGAGERHLPPRAGAVPGGAADHEGAAGDFLQQLHLGAGGAGGAERLPPAPPPLLRRPLAAVDPPPALLPRDAQRLPARQVLHAAPRHHHGRPRRLLPARLRLRGAGLGRLYGEIMAKVFPEGIVSDGLRIAIGPAAYALAGAAAYSGAVTHTLSTALLVFELTGQMSHVLPVLIAVLVANGLSQRLQASFFDGIIIAKQLPYLPKLGVGQSGAHDIYAEDFMVRDLKYLPRGCRFKDVRGLLKASSLKQFPLVDSQESRILLGSIRRKHLAKLLSEQLSTEKRFQYLLRQSEANSPTEPLLGADGASGTPEEKPGAPKVSAEPGDGETSKEEERGTQLSVKMKDVCHLVEDWECQQLQEPVRLEELSIDPAPYRLLEKETLYQCYDLFNLLGLRTAYVTNVGRLVGVVSLRELKAAVEGSVKGTFVRCRERDGDPDPNGASA